MYRTHRDIDDKMETLTESPSSDMSEKLETVNGKVRSISGVVCAIVQEGITNTITIQGIPGTINEDNIKFLKKSTS